MSFQIGNSVGPLAAVSAPSALEIWGGVESTCNRVRDHYFDQMEISGHALRLEDYDLFAGLGLKTLRVGMLWERHECDPGWHWSDQRLNRLRQLGVRPIAGLVHHGSGPRHTNLHDPRFAEKLAAYAGEFAERYAWIDSYTPVNEPNTTARFSSMYGIWYPHRVSRAEYLRSLVNQLRATVLSMQAIRRVRQNAKLIQTEDIGRTFGTRRLNSLCDLMNLRRWLTYDLLCGRVDRSHPMFRYMQSGGISEKEILWFTDHPCPPDILGINYYVTSDRFLDHRLHLYSEDRRSAEGPFADIEAVRVHAGGIVGMEAMLTEAWERYRIPVAITEVHLACTVEEQIRWLSDAWEGAMRARRSGVSCVALTTWALLGSYFWNELVTRDNGHYEAGAFDMRSGSPRPTELAQVIAQIASGRRPSHTALASAGWWQRPGRLCFRGPEELAA